MVVIIKHTYTKTGYKQDQKEKKEAAADRKKRQQPQPSSVAASSQPDHQAQPVNLSSLDPSSETNDPQGRSTILPPTISPSITAGQQSHSEVTAMNTST